MMNQVSKMSKSRQSPANKKVKDLSTGGIKSRVSNNNSKDSNTNSNSNSNTNKKDNSKRRNRRAARQKPRTFSEDSTQGSLGSTSTAETALTSSSLEMEHGESGCCTTSTCRSAKRRGGAGSKNSNPQQSQESLHPNDVDTLYSHAHHDISQSEKDKYLALDCEMVGIGPGGMRSALARVSIISWDGHLVLDTHVKVQEEVTDYRTFVSGIQPQHIQSNEALEPEECRKIVADLLHGKILVGHALKNDLQALELKHPWYDTRDTSKYIPYMKYHAYEERVLVPRKLRDLASDMLGRNIQLEGQEHCSIVDAEVAFDLYKLVRDDWEQVIEYKVNRTKEIEALSQLQKQIQQQQQQQQQEEIQQLNLPVIECL